VDIRRTTGFVSLESGRVMETLAWLLAVDKGGNRRRTARAAVTRWRKREVVGRLAKGQWARRVAVGSGMSPEE
jgi:hypothetical protein